MGKCQHQQLVLELLGFCDRGIVVAKPAEMKVQRMPQTRTPADPKTIGEHMIKKRIEMRMTSTFSFRLSDVSSPCQGSFNKGCVPAIAAHDLLG